MYLLIAAILLIEGKWMTTVQAECLDPEQQCFWDQHKVGKYFGQLDNYAWFDCVNCFNDTGNYYISNHLKIKSLLIT